MPSTSRKSPQKRGLVNRLAPHGGFVEPKVKRKRKLNATAKFDASPEKKTAQQLAQQQQQLKSPGQKNQNHQHGVKMPASSHIRTLQTSPNASKLSTSNFSASKLSASELSTSKLSAAKMSAAKATAVARTILKSKLKKPLQNHKSSSSSSSSTTASPQSQTLQRKSLSSPISPVASSRPSSASSTTSSSTSSTKSAASKLTPNASRQKLEGSVSRPSRTLMYKCRYCGKMIKRSDNLTRHELVVHQDKVIHSRCRICGATFRSSFSKNSHMKQVHGNVSAAPTVSMGRPIAPIKVPSTTKNKKKYPYNEQKMIKPVASIDEVIQELVGDLGKNEENAIFVEKVRSKWFESPKKSAINLVDSLPPPPHHPPPPHSPLANCQLNQSSTSSPGKHSKRELIQKIIMSKNKQKVKMPILKDQSLSSNGIS